MDNHFLFSETSDINLTGRINSMVVDIGIAIVMVYLIRRQNHFARTKRMISRLMIVIVSSGSFTAVLAVIMLILTVLGRKFGRVETPPDNPVLPLAMGFSRDRQLIVPRRSAHRRRLGRALNVGRHDPSISADGVVKQWSAISGQDPQFLASTPGHAWKCLVVRRALRATRDRQWELHPSTDDAEPCLFIISASDNKRLVLHDVRSAPGGTIRLFYRPRVLGLQR
ncbi:hypothetical protein C0993_007646 [Termitomyces sp. T159_Od127]|nr:hypothetical protein C0993_007646 [Termitomyces sp. T159_Od127]